MEQSRRAEATQTLEVVDLWFSNFTLLTVVQGGREQEACREHLYSIPPQPFYDFRSY